MALYRARKKHAAGVPLSAMEAAALHAADENAGVS